MIAATVLLALAGPAAAVCKGAPRAPAADFLADENAHRALRDEMGVPMPTAPEHITIYTEGGHLATTRISIVATRSPDGRWHSDAIGRSKIWVEGATPSDMPRVARTLSADDSQKIDALLERPAFWRQQVTPRTGDGPPSYDLMPRRIDVVTPSCAQRWITAGDQPALLAELDALVTPR